MAWLLWVKVTKWKHTAASVVIRSIHGHWSAVSLLEFHSWVLKAMNPPLNLGLPRSMPNGNPYISRILEVSSMHSRPISFILCIVHIVSLILAWIALQHKSQVNQNRFKSSWFRSSSTIIQKFLLKLSEIKISLSKLIGIDWQWSALRGILDQCQYFDRHWVLIERVQASVW